MKFIKVSFLSLIISIAIANIAIANIATADHFDGAVAQPFPSYVPIVMSSMTCPKYGLWNRLFNNEKTYTANIYIPFVGETELMKSTVTVKKSNWSFLHGKYMQSNYNVSYSRAVLPHVALATIIAATGYGAYKLYHFVSEKLQNQNV